MKTWKLVSGVLSIILFVIVAFQSCIAGVGNTLSGSGEISGSAGIIVAIMLLSGGIVSVATRKSGKGGDIALIVLYGIGALLGITLAGEMYTDLIIWGGWCLICGVASILDLVKKSHIFGTNSCIVYDNTKTIDIAEDSSSSQYCTSCGKEMQKGWESCPYCGVKIQKSENKNT